MLYGLSFIVIFIIGFAFGLAMPFILQKMNIYKKEIMIEEKNNNPSTNMTELFDEWLNGKRGDN